MKKAKSNILFNFASKKSYDRIEKIQNLSAEFELSLNFCLKTTIWNIIETCLQVISLHSEFVLIL